MDHICIYVLFESLNLMESDSEKPPQVTARMVNVVKIFKLLTFNTCIIMNYNERKKSYIHI